MFKKNYELYELFVVINGEFMVIRVKKNELLISRICIQRIASMLYVHF